MKLVALVLAALLTALSFGVASATPPERINRAMAMSAEVRGSLELSTTNDDQVQKNVDYCSAVAIGSSGEIVTFALAKHCVATTSQDMMFFTVTVTPTPQYLEFADGSSAPVLIGSIIADPIDDVAFLSVVKRGRTPHATYSQRPLVRGQRLFVIGDAENQGWVYAEGYSTRGTDFQRSAIVDGSPQWSKTLSVSCASCAPGDSGGGVFDEMTGDLLGIVVAGDQYAMLIEPVSVVNNDYKRALPLAALPTQEPTITPAPMPTNSPTLK